VGRSAGDDELSPYAKYEVFKKAYDTVNFFTASGNLLAAFVLCFSILEDRLCATVVICSRSSHKKIDENKLSKIMFKKKIDYLLKIDAINLYMHERLEKAAHLRNELTHKMMWRLDVFSLSHIKMLRSLINEFQRIQRKGEKINSIKTKSSE
jgi:hypothetical protein